MEWDSFFKTVGVFCNFGLENDNNIIATTQLPKPYGFSGILYKRITIYPQYEVMIDKSNPNIDIDFNPKVDIAIFLDRVDYESDTIIETRKLAIECDGYEFHKDTYTNDLIRTRAIKQSGFKDLLRFSGSEIYKTSDNYEKIQYNFNQLIDIIMS